MPKTNSRVRFNDQATVVSGDDAHSSKRQRTDVGFKSKKDGIIRETSLLYDESNDIEIIPFTEEEGMTMDDDVNEVRRRRRTVQDSSQNEQQGDEDDEDNAKEEGDGGESEQDSEDSDDDKIERIVKRKKKNFEDDQVDDDDDDDNGDGDKETRDSLKNEKQNEQDCIATLIKCLKKGESAAQALKRIANKKNRREIVQACEGCTSTMTGVKREDLLHRLKQWELCWGETIDEGTGSGMHGPFETVDFEKWARARYFVQSKVGWVRAVGGKVWWKASDVFI